MDTQQVLTKGNTVVAFIGICAVSPAMGLLGIL